MELTCSMATRLVESCLWDLGNSQRQVVLYYAVGPYSGCIGGAWVAFNGGNSGGIYRWFMNWYGILEGI